MAGYLPPEEDIQSFMACISGVSRQEIIARIKGNNNSVENAINEWFDNQGDNSSKYRWVDGQFSDGRDGEYMPNSTPSFNIHAPDETVPYNEVREPQTRPPSRTANKGSPVATVIDLTEEHGKADPRTSLAHDDDEELLRAIEESRKTAGLPPQESGVSNTDEVHFGPATRNEYEENKWGMVSMGKTTAQEILLDPEPAARKRDLNVPAFLKPSVDDTRLNALFTIYHEIPLLREVFMNRSDVQQNYGINNEWWSGKAIEVPYMTGSEPDDGQELLYEIQRLMAFLDKTDRSYGSVDSLANLRAVNKTQKRASQNGLSADLETAVWESWKKVFASRETGQVSKIFSVGVESEQRTESTEFAILDLPQPSQASGLETLYDVADEALWGLPPYSENEISSSSYLEHMADVITFRFKWIDASNPLVIPAVWYPDRYLKANRQAALDMRIQKTEVMEQLERISKVQDVLTQFVVRGKLVKVDKLFKAALQHDVDQPGTEIEVDPNETFLSEEAAMAQASSDAAAKLSTELEKIVASIDKKLQSLESEKEKARDTMRQLSRLYTEPSSDPNEPPTHKYTLRGISTTKSTMYIRKKAEIDLIDMGLDNDGSAIKGDQWWRIHYASSGADPVSVEKKTEEEVLEAGKTESKNILLVYASEKAMQFESKSLPLPLETFVHNDNKMFKSEFPADESESQLASPGGKRKFDEQSDQTDDSGEFNRWTGGPSPKGYENMQVMERDLIAPDSLASARAASQGLTDQLDESRTVTPDEISWVIQGLDPTKLGSDDEKPKREMQERSGMSMLTASSSRDATIDSMDLDVVEDEHAAEESAAVKRMGLT